MTTRRNDGPPGAPGGLDLPPELAELDAMLGQRGRLALKAPSNAPASGFAANVLAQAKAAEAAEKRKPAARVLEVPATRQRSESPARTMRWFAAAAATVLLLAAGGYFWSGAVPLGRDDNGDPLRPGSMIVAGAEPRWALLDGQRVQAYLAPGSTLEVHSGQRVSLRSGEAWFMVKPKSGAFAVEAPEATVHVVGTTFNVSMEAGGLAVRTHSGEVRVEAPSAEAASVSADQEWTSTTRAVTVRKLADLPERSGLLWDWARAGAPKKGYYPSASGATVPKGPRTHQPAAGSASP